MINLILRFLVTALGLWLATKIVPGVHVASLGSLLAAALLLGIVNAIVRPIITLLTLPITIVTLGLFLLVVNGLMVELVAWFLKGFSVHGLIAAIFTTIVVWAVSLAANMFIGGDADRRRR